VTQLGQQRRPIDRSNDRLVAMLSIAGALAWLIAALVAAALPAGIRVGIWLPIHLAFAGGATTAIAGVMPFFSAAFAAAPPMDIRLRLAALGAVVFGAIGVSTGVVVSQPLAAALAGVLYLVGIGLVAVATVRPLARGLGPARGLVTQGYVAALMMVALGGLVAILNLAGVRPIVDLWPFIKVGHVWLNLVGFVSLVIATTLLHLFPTVVGARIVVRSTARLTVLGLAAGALFVAAGLALRMGAIAWLGALSVAAGAAGLAAYCAQTWRTRAHWTTDAGWHAFSMGGLIAAVFWFDVGIAVAAVRVLQFGDSPLGWSAPAALAPLLVGWMGFAIVASANHLVPSIGPGDPVAHERQRRVLGRLAITRLVVLNLGVAALALGAPLGIDELNAVGLVLIGTGLLITAVLILSAVAAGLRQRAG
jgi:nitrite reductase (NO-forming)